jgi:hypothetical protein
MPDCPAFDQSGTGMKKNNDAGTNLVLEEADAGRHCFGLVLYSNNGCQNSDGGISFLDTDAQLRFLHSCNFEAGNLLLSSSLGDMWVTER